MRGNNKPGKSGYFGVFWHERANKWGCQVRMGKKTKYLGLFEEKKDAARAFDKMSKKLHGKDANLNFRGEK